MMMEAETGVCHHKARNAKDYRPQLKLEETRRESPPQPLEEEWLVLRTRSHRTSTYRTEREQISVALSHSVCGHLFQQP